MKKVRLLLDGLVGLGLAATLTAAVIGLLAFAEAWSTDHKCFNSIATSKFPNWLGCTLAAHEGLAAGLIGAAGALFAAWVAYRAIQNQIKDSHQSRLEDQKRAEETRARQEAEAKLIAILCITQPVHAAATALFVIIRVLVAPSEQGYANVELLLKQLRSSLESFTLKEALRNLGLDDSLIYVAIVNTLSTFVSIAQESPAGQTRTQRLETLRDTLMRLHHYLRAFDADLAAVFARDSQTIAPSRPANSA